SPRERRVMGGSDTTGVRNLVMPPENRPCGRPIAATGAAGLSRAQRGIANHVAARVDRDHGGADPRRAERSRAEVAHTRGAAPYKGVNLSSGRDAGPGDHTILIHSDDLRVAAAE